MRMDGSTRATTVIDDETGSIMLRRLHPWIASYNDLIMFAVRSNMDIKHIGSGEGAKALIYYITDYITKANLPTELGLAALLYAINRTSEKYKGVSEWEKKSTAGAVTILINSMLSKQEMSHPQIMSYLVGGGDHYTSHRYRVLHFGAFERTVTDRIDVDNDQDDRSVRGAAVGRDNDENITLALGAGSISAINQQQDYVYRPSDSEFVDMCLYEFVGLTEKITVKAEERRLAGRVERQSFDARRGRPEEARGKFIDGHPQCETHVLRKRVLWVVPVILGDRIPRRDRSEDEKELWARTMIMFFLPWRCPGDMRRATETWSEAYDRKEHLIKEGYKSIMENMNVLSECKDARDRVSRMRAARLNGSPRETGSVSCPHINRDGDEPGNEPTGIELDGEPEEPTEEDALGSLDALVTLPTRLSLDLCYAAGEQSIVEPAYGSATVTSDADRASLADEQRRMIDLKRKRRPEPEDDGGDSHRHTRRRGNQDPVMEIGSLAESDDVGTSSGRHMATDPDYILGFASHIVSEFGLDGNEEQRRAFDIVARHVADGDNQLLMYIGGVGGTGKSHVVNAILKLFELTGR
ncbi:hypothetical protein C8Q76DRAFT_577991, partial [Earliella scabrosa]